MRWLGLLLRLVVLLGALLWLTNQPGSAKIVWHDYVIETSAAVLVLLGLGFSVVLFLLFRLWRFVLDGPRFWRLRQKIKKLERGQGLVTQGLVAIAAGDGPEAGRLAVAARKLLGITPVTRLIQAQAAQLAGDHRAAQEIYTAMAVEADSAVLGYRGLIMSAMRAENWAEAEKYVEKLRRLKPETPWLSLVQFQISTRRENWAEAQQALTAARKANLVDKQRASRYQATLLLASATATNFASRSVRVMVLAEQAARLMPNWLPAVLSLAALQAQAGHNRAAKRLIERCWADQPHPDLAALYGTLSRKSEDPLATYKQIESLAKVHADTTVAQLALAEAALAADLWGAARRHLLSIASRKDATQIVFRLLAKLERRETGDERAISQWLVRLGDALPDARWICQNCGGGSQTWAATCPHCSGFDAMEWQIPGAPLRVESRRLNAALLSSAISSET